MTAMLLTFLVNFLERFFKFFHAGNYLHLGLCGVPVVPGTLSLTGHCFTCWSHIFLVAATLSGIMRGVRTPMLLAKFAIFFNARGFRARMLGLLWNSPALREFLGGLFQALRFCGPCRGVRITNWVRNLYAFQDQQEGLNSFWVTLFKQVVLVLPLQRTHAQDVACKFRIREGLDLLRMQYANLH